jgi:RNA polymerase sigma-70 factor, ECF subfamily
MNQPSTPNAWGPRPVEASQAPAAGHANVSELPLGALSDATLVAALVQGSQRAASVIWQRHSPAVRRMLERSLGPDQEIEDLVQEVFIGLLKSADKLEDASTLRSYLVAIAFRTAAMEIRRRKVRRWVKLTADGDVPDGPNARDDEPDERRALRALHRILDTLSTRDRLVFVARYVEGLQIDETAAALKLSKATVWRVGKSSFEHVLARAEQCSLLAEYVERALKGRKQ